MNRLFLALFFIWAQSIQSQTPTPDSKKIKLGINFSPDLCYRTLANTGKQWWGNGYIEERNNIEIPKAGFTAGLNLCFNIKKRVDFELGLQYSNKGHKTKKYDVPYSQLDPSLPKQSKQIYSIDCIDIPFRVNFTTGKKKIRFFTSAGATTNFFLNVTQTTFSYYSDHTEKETIDVNYQNNINISLRVSAGIDYIINERMNLRMEPTFTHGILTLDGAPIKRYLYNGGLNFGFYFGI